MRIYHFGIWALLAPNLLIAGENMCDEAARWAANDVGVPLKVMQALTRTETGREKAGVLQPWPWTVNMEGEGRWFSDAQSAQSYVFKHFKAGARSFDVGCFQINYKWHGAAFQSIESMFDPKDNARYAAQFLKSLKSSKNSWEDAAAAYHSRTPAYATKYKARFAEVLSALSIRPQSTSSQADENRFPLLRFAGKGTLGSLVNIGTPPAKPLFTIGGRG